MCSNCAGSERIPGLVWRRVAHASDVGKALAQGSAARATGTTAMNVASSRSHALLAVRLAPTQPGGAPTTLHMVDLAGVQSSPWHLFCSEGGPSCAALLAVQLAPAQPGGVAITLHPLDLAGVCYRLNTWYHLS